MNKILNGYRFGVAVREFGERMAHIKILGIPALRWCCGLVVNIGLAIEGLVRNRPVGGGKSNGGNGVGNNFGFHYVMSWHSSRRALFRLV